MKDMDNKRIVQFLYNNFGGLSVFLNTSKKLPVFSVAFACLLIVAAQNSLFGQNSKTVSAMFTYILRDGKIHSSYSGDASALAAKFSPDYRSISTADMESRIFHIKEISRKQVPTMVMKQGEWLVSDAARQESTYAGEDFYAKGFRTRKVQYFRYSGKIPFFPPRSVYNNLHYITAEKKSVPVLERFSFYRWKGETFGQKIDTYMIALDTYTNLIFAYTKISQWKEIFGHQMPTKYSSLDTFVDSAGNERAFYEYDPAGYVAADGSIVLYDWYIQNTAKRLEEQLVTLPPLGKSPYYSDEKINAFLPQE